MLAETHSVLLRTLADDAGTHFEGLQTAARYMRKHKRMDDGLVKKLCKLEEAYHLVRHITRPFCFSLVAQVRQALLEDDGSWFAPAFV